MAIPEWIMILISVIYNVIILVLSVLAFFQTIHYTEEWFEDASFDREMKEKLLLDKQKNKNAYYSKAITEDAERKAAEKTRREVIYHIISKLNEKADYLYQYKRTTQFEDGRVDGVRLASVIVSEIGNEYERTKDIGETL